MIGQSEVSNPLLTAETLSFSYPDNPQILIDLNFNILPGQKVGLIGPNGAGKTTLFLTICGMLKPTAGRIALLGQQIVSGKFNPQVAMVFQNPDDQLFCPTVRDDVAFGLQNMGLSREETEHRINEALLTVGAQKLAERPVHHLSMGEKRIVSIAGVLAMRPELIMYDEPSANLDIRTRRRLIDLLKASAKTMIVASHDLELILEVCDRVMLLDKGKMYADGNPRQIMSDTQLMEAHGQERPHSISPHQILHHQSPAPFDSANRLLS